MSRNIFRELGDAQPSLLNSLVESVRQSVQPRIARFTRIFNSGGSKILTIPPETALFLGNQPYVVVYHLPDRVLMELIPNNRKRKPKRNTPTKTEPVAGVDYVRDASDNC
jgi:hypothetical protein